MLVRGLWLDRLLTAKDKSAMNDRSTQSQKEPNRFVTVPYSHADGRPWTYMILPELPLRSRWSGALQPARRRNSPHSTTTHALKPLTVGPISSMSRMAKTTLAQCRIQLDVWRGKGKASIPHIIKISLPDIFIRKDLHAKLKILAGEEEITDEDVKRISESSIGECQDSVDAPPLLYTEIVPDAAHDIDGHASSSSQSTSSFEKDENETGQSSSRHSEDKQKTSLEADEVSTASQNQLWSYMPAEQTLGGGIIPSLERDSIDLLQDRCRASQVRMQESLQASASILRGEEICTVSASAVIGEKEGAACVHKATALETITTLELKYHDKISIDVDAGSESDRQETFNGDACIPDMSTSEIEGEVVNIEGTQKSNEVTLDNSAIISDQDDQCSWYTSALAPTDPPLPSTSKSRRQSIRTIKPSRISRYMHDIGRITESALDMLCKKLEKDARYGIYTTSASMDTTEQQPRQKIFMQDDQLPDVDIHAIWLFKEALLPPMKGTTFESVKVLGATATLSLSAEYNLPMPPSILKAWHDANPKEKVNDGSFLYDCLIPILAAFESSADRASWAVDLADHLLDEKCSEDHKAHTIVSSKTESQVDSSPDDCRLKEATSLVVGFVACLDQLCTVPYSLRLNTTLRTIFLQECRAKALASALKVVMKKTRVAAQIPKALCQGNVWDAFKEDLACRLNSEGHRKTFITNPVKAGCLESSVHCKDKVYEVDKAIIIMINEIDEPWHCNRIAAARATAVNQDEVSQGTKKHLREDKAMSRIITNLKSRLKFIQADMARGPVKGSIYDRDLSELQSRSLAALLRALRLGLSSSDGFHSLLVYLMQQMKYASIELKMIIRIAEKDKTWEVFTPLYVFTKHLQGLEAMHQYWRKSLLGRDYSTVVADSMLEKIRYTIATVTAYSKNTRQLLNLAEQAKEAPLVVSVAKGKALRFNVESSIQLLDYIDTTSSRLNLTTWVSETEFLRNNLAFQCVNLALALLWKGDSTADLRKFKEYTTMDSTNKPDNVNMANFSHLMQFFEHATQDTDMCPDCKVHYECSMDSQGQLKLSCNSEDGTIISMSGFTNCVCEKGKKESSSKDMEEEQELPVTLETAQQLRRQIITDADAICKANSEQRLKDVNYLRESMLPRVQRVEAGDKGCAFLGAIALSIKNELSVLTKSLRGAKIEQHWTERMHQIDQDVSDIPNQLFFEAGKSKERETTIEMLSKAEVARIRLDIDSQKHISMVEDLIELLELAMTIFYCAKICQAMELKATVNETLPECITDEYIKQLQIHSREVNDLKKESESLRIVDKCVKRCGPLYGDIFAPTKIKASAIRRDEAAGQKEGGLSCGGRELKLKGVDEKGPEQIINREMERDELKRMEVALQRKGELMDVLQKFCTSTDGRIEEASAHLTISTLPKLRNILLHSQCTLGLTKYVVTMISLQETLEYIEKKAKDCGLDEAKIRTFVEMRQTGAGWIAATLGRKDVIETHTRHMFDGYYVKEGCTELCRKYSQEMVSIFKMALVLFYNAVASLANQRASLLDKISPKQITEEYMCQLTEQIQIVKTLRRQTEESLLEYWNEIYKIKWKSFEDRFTALQESMQIMLEEYKGKQLEEMNAEKLKAKGSDNSLSGRENETSASDKLKSAIKVEKGTTAQETQDQLKSLVSTILRINLTQEMASIRYLTKTLIPEIEKATSSKPGWQFIALVLSTVKSTMTHLHTLGRTGDETDDTLEPRWQHFLDDINVKVKNYLILSSKTDQVGNEDCWSECKMLTRDSVRLLASTVEWHYLGKSNQARTLQEKALKLNLDGITDGHTSYLKDLITRGQCLEKERHNLSVMDHFKERFANRMKAYRVKQSETIIKQESIAKDLKRRLQEEEQIQFDGLKVKNPDGCSKDGKVGSANDVIDELMTQTEDKVAEMSKDTFGDQEEDSEASRRKAMVQSLQDQLKGLISAIRKINSSHQSADIDYFKRKLLPQVHKCKPGIKEKGFLSLIIKNALQTISDLNMMIISTNDDNRYSQQLKEIHTKGENGFSNFVEQAKVIESRSHKNSKKVLEQLWVIFKPQIESVLGMLMSASISYYLAKTDQAKSLMKSAEGFIQPCITNKYLEELKTNIEIAEEMKRVAENFNIVEHFKQTNEGAWYFYRPEEEERKEGKEQVDRCELKQMTGFIRKEILSTQTKSIEYLTDKTLPRLLETKPGPFEIAEMVIHLTSMQETLKYIENQARECRVDNQTLIRLSEIWKNSAVLVEGMTNRPDIKEVLNPDVKHISEGISIQVDCIDVCKGISKKIVTLFKEAILLFSTAILQLVEEKTKKTPSPSSSPREAVEQIAAVKSLYDKSQENFVIHYYSIQTEKGTALQKKVDAIKSLAKTTKQQSQMEERRKSKGKGKGGLGRKEEQEQEG